ncbi:MULTISPECIES: prolipoprotein diacylglyceryl transferase [Corynebacterium]|uniref:prolipoprotein diacylglyceryl transferase n=1 Tax=Corynebacterium TaxID=1716 RepID=UPI0003B86E8F|nr:MULTISPECIES: prolipoprotein diacylglyceryl transferase [Corynebacterium]ERS39943.1 prolipoprotein diacylglyceryl transferase [Corynebacterium sp. KPL1995]ERS73413.1 prolipoprotein diacylglyceryl transferase [Corynebacterium sp. KPL1989]MDK4304685.1 prolipoprotein diacylglyceryl transferase [Corynebacterium pseudodiphtheriticum]MDK8682844.1 prolipoprotein diacylglyceryl transferase [Corynebacterium pseudodiphtheriticum]MDK8804764.1 prolipoprotein diacylglyceryl transferase [Corynebacterium 
MVTDFLANIPSPPQGVWQLGPLPLRAYALCIIAGIIVALYITQARYVRVGGDSNVVWDAAILAIPAGVIGGRVYHVITDHHKYFCADCDPVDALRITNGGLGIWGAIALGTIAVAVMFKIRGIRLAPFADAAAPAIVLAQGIGRLGNWFNQELYGRATDVPWALEIYQRVDENGNYAPVAGTSTGEVIATVHPTFLYELLWNVAIFVFLLWVHKRFRLGGGQVFALYVVGYTAGRFWIELMRSDEATLLFDVVRVNAVVSVVACVLAIVALDVLGKRFRRQVQEGLVDPAAPAKPKNSD